MTDVQSRATTQMEAIQECIDALNRIDGIEARADAAEWLAKTYRDAANTNAAQEASR